MLGSFSTGERRALRILMVIVVISRLALAFRPQWQLYTRPYNDDAFYIFSVSYNLAHGHGLSVDGVHPTNGIQPLVTVLYTPVFMIAGDDKVLAIRLTFILNALFDILSILFLANLIRVLTRNSTEEKNIWLRPPILGVIGWTALYAIIMQTNNGLETGLYSMLLLAVMYLYAKLQLKAQSPSLLEWIGFGSLLGVTVLARIDAVFLVACIILIEVIRFRSEGIRRAFIIGISSVAVSSVWWIYNYMLFGSIMPQSGMAESLKNVLVENITRASAVLSYIGGLFFFLPGYGVAAWIPYAWMAILLVTIIVATRRLHLINYLRANYQLEPLLPFVFFGVCLIIYYVFFFSAPHFLPRYFQPIRILWLVICCCAAPNIIGAIRSLMQQRRAIGIGFLTVSMLAIVGFNGSRYINYFTVSTSSEMYQAGLWAERHPNSLIGMEQSGTTAFMSDNIVNLDGKVDFEALKAKQRGDIGSYIVARDLEYLADWSELVEPMVASAAQHGARYEPVDSAMNVIIYKRIGK
jgi:hypothetical protein